MESPDKEYLNDLLRLKNKVDNSLVNENLEMEKHSFYNALKTIIEIKINEEEFYSRFDQLEEVFVCLASGNFERRIDLPNQNNLFSRLATHINTAIKELEAKVKKNEFVQASIECISEAALVTDKKGIILFVNDEVPPLLNSSRENLIDLIVANIFENHTSFGIPDRTPPFKEVKVNIRPLNSTLRPVFLTVKSIKGSTGQIDGYIYLMKPAN